jgi:hypothetical protein
MDPRSSPPPFLTPLDPEDLEVVHHDGFRAADPLADLFESESVLIELRFELAALCNSIGAAL